MRVVGGSSRGRSLRAPPGNAIRPTSDRVREAIFDVLGSMLDLSGMAVADLFCGTGAMGIEALSRGAGSVVFVDSDGVAVETVKKNLAGVGLEGASARVVRSDVLRWLSQSSTAEFDLALVDPPYAFSDWQNLLGGLPAEVAVLESDREIDVPTRFKVIKTKRYGGTLVTVVRAAGTAVR